MKKLQSSALVQTWKSHYPARIAMKLCIDMHAPQRITSNDVSDFLSCSSYTGITLTCEVFTSHGPQMITPCDFGDLRTYPLASVIRHFVPSFMFPSGLDLMMSVTP